MDVKEPDLAGTYTYADYMTWTWDEMVELIHGKIFKMSPGPGSFHQEISINLILVIGAHIRGKRCKVYSAPFDVRLPAVVHMKNDKLITTVVQPDICVICDPKKIDKRGCLGAPDWIIEILSPITSKKDKTIKLKLYEEAGVLEYWIVNPTNKTIQAYQLNDRGKYDSTRPFVTTELISPSIFPDLQIPLEQVFQ